MTPKKSSNKVEGGRALVYLNDQIVLHQATEAVIQTSAGNKIIHLQELFT